MLTAKIENPIPVINDEKDLEGWDEFPEGYEEEEDDDCEQSCKGDDNKPK